MPWLICTLAFIYALWDTSMQKNIRLWGLQSEP